MMLINSKLPSVGTTVFSVMSKLAIEHNAINLSQGFPDFATDPKLIEAVSQAMQSGHNQYAPMHGIATLREYISDKTLENYQAVYDAETEITITAGGTQAIFTALSAIVVPGDEVIIFEPAYDSYAPTVKLLGGLVKPFELQAPNYRIDWEMVKKLFSVKTKLIIINTPHNPTGTILAPEDIQALTKLVNGTDVLILSDEVYEHLTYNGKQHLSLALYPELACRSFIVASFGKLLHTTGWKIGYCLAPAKLMAEFRKVHQFNVFSVNTPMQVGIANYLRNINVVANLKPFFAHKRDLFRSLMKDTKFKLLPCDGSYFQCASYEGISSEKDTEMAARLTTEFGVAAIPLSAFYTNRTDHNILRFCFAKEDSTLHAATQRLSKV